MGDSEGGQRELYHLYDWAMRLWAESNLAGVAGWLDPALSGLPTVAFVKRSTALNSTLFKESVIHADLILSAGPERLMHVEFETSPKSNLIQRMFEYRMRIMGEHPDVRLTQHAIVLGDGRVKGYDDLKAHGISMELPTIYLREHDPMEYLSDPMLAPLAVLARGSRREREQSLGAAMRLLSGSGHPLARTWLMCAKAVAEIRLDRSTIGRIEKENIMDPHPVVLEFLRDQEFIQGWIKEGRQEGWELGQARGRAEGQARGQAQGQAQGRIQGRERVLLALLRARFGNTPEAEQAARKLVDWDEEAAVAAITAATDSASLLNAKPPASSRP